MSRTLAPLEFYDEPRIHGDYQAARARVDEPNLTLEEPYVLAFLGDVAGRAVLDLGCGTAAVAGRLLDAGARSYAGVDGSRLMVDRARAALDDRARIELGDLETWVPAGPYDTVLARMSLHYVVDLAGLLRRVRAACTDGARLVFSVEHPVVTCSYDADWDEDGVPRQWRVRSYFDEGPRSCPWLGARVVKQHRTLQTYLATLQLCGFDPDEVSEGEPSSERFEDADVWRRRREVPMYLTVGATARRSPSRGDGTCG